MFVANFKRVVELNALGGHSNRMQKLQEEQGELAKAITDGNADDVTSEAVDVLLMLLSIFEDAVPGQAEHMDVWCDTFFGLAQGQREAIGFDEAIITRHYMRLCALIGQVAEANQRLDGIASSGYKNDGGFDPITTAAYRREDLQRAMCNVFDILARTGKSEADIQTVYDEKMNKWERVSK